MKIVALFAIVFIQVLVFQIALVRLSRSIPGILIGSEALPEAIAKEIARYDRHLGRNRMILGAGLIVLAVLAAFVLPISPGARKLTLAAISITSSAAMIIGYLQDRSKVMRIERSLPQAERLIASLEPRSLRTFYHPAWEAVPPLFLLLSAAVTIRAGTPGIAPWIFLALQAAFVLYMSIVTLHGVNRHSCLTPRTKSFHGSPEQALALERRMRRVEVRHSLISKIVISILFTTIQMRRFSGASEQTRGWLLIIELGMIFAVMAWFVRYVMVIAKLRKELSA